MFKIVVDESNNNINVNSYLDYIGLSNQRKKQLLNNDLCYINKIPCKGNDVLQNSDLFEIDLSIFDVKKYRPIEYNLTILYEDEYIIVVDKPVGYIIYDTDNDKPSICNFLSYYYKQYKKKCDIYPIHRLDQDTTGCLIFAKDLISASNLSKSFEKNEVTKKYVSLVSGVLNKEGSINKNIGKDRHINGKMVICERGKPALTKYKVLKSNNKLSLVEAIPVTGRTHQVRIHLASIGNPLVGDSLYGSKVKFDRVLLHCQSISFIHPIKKKAVTVFSPLPLEFKQI